MSPGLPVDKLIVSSRDLARHAPQPSTWSPAHLVAAMMEGGWAATLAPTQETVQQVPRELSTKLHEVSKYPEKTPARAYSLFKALHFTHNCPGAVLG